MKARLVHLGNAVARRAWKHADGWAAQYWHDFPFGRAPRAARERYQQLWEAEKQNSYPEIDAYEQKAGHAVDAGWLHELALHTQIVIKDSPLCYQHGRVLYAALRRYLQEHSGPLTILETGTARGFSAVVMARALEDAGAQGRIITFDLLPHDTAMYWNCIDDHDKPKTRRGLLTPWAPLIDQRIIFAESDSRIGLARTATGRVGFAFLDGAHSYEDVLNEFEAVAARQQEGDIIVFDDYSENVFPGLVRAVDEGSRLWGYEADVIRSNQQRAYVVARKRG